MTKLRDLATITPVGLKRAAGTDVASRAYMVWLAAVSDNKKLTESSKPGTVLYKGTLTSVILNLYPELSASHRADELEHVRKEIYSYLRATENATCISRGTTQGHGVIWEIRSLWKEPDGPVTLKVTATHTKPTARENRLTPHEAGEDRAPQPVTVTTALTHETKDAPMTATAAPPREMTDHEQLVSLVEMCLGESTEPLTAVEVGHALGIERTTATNALRELVEGGRIFSRVETPAERSLRFGVDRAMTARPSKLFSTRNPVPDRTQREGVSGFVAAPAGVIDQVQRGTNPEAMFAAMSSTRFESAIKIGRRAGVKHGSIYAAIAALVKADRVETRPKRTSGQKVITLYRRKATAVTPPVKRTEVPPVTTVAAPPVAVEMGDARAKAISAVDDLIRSIAGNAQSAKLKELRDDNARLTARVAELETALADIRSALGRS